MKEITDINIDEVACWKNNETNKQGIYISWSANIGFGELTLYSEDEVGVKWNADTETLCSNEDKEFIRAILNKWVDDMEVVG